MEHITYLLGAGASAKCLPIVSEMSGQISRVADQIDQQLNSFAIKRSGAINKEDANSMLRDLRWLSKVCDVKKNFSVDTFAKKLKLSEKLNDYDKLKNILTLYFTLQQKFSSPDVRYDNFWASLLNHKYSLPQNVKVLSWNYDFQMELSYQDFISSGSLSQSAKQLNIVSHKNPHQGDVDNKFAIFKLNGSATYNSDVIENGQNYIIDKIKDCNNEEVIAEAIDFYLKSKSNSAVRLSTHLTYAWEHQQEDLFYKNLQSGLLNTTILVVIGYSFPYFNRTVDKLILNKDYMPHLKKAYFQDEKPDNIKERFRAINENLPNDKLIPIHDTYQFYFPNEL